MNGSLIRHAGINHRARLFVAPLFFRVASAEFCGATGVTIDGAFFIAGGAVVFLLGDGGEIGGVVFGRHGYGAKKETGEGGVPVEDVAALGVDVEQIEGG